jgi:hypothetical protein
MNKQHLMAAAALSLLGSTTACSMKSSGVRVEPVSVTAEVPGRVSALVAVSDREAPVEDLSPSSFEVREDGVPLNASQVQLRIKSLGELPGHEALVLVDASRPFPKDEREPLGGAIGQLIDRLRFHQTVTLMAFDGSPNLRFVARYERTQTAAPLQKDPGLARLLSFKPRDNSSSLYSAVVQGRKELDARLAKSPSPHRTGTLVFLARSPDLAGRADADAARAALVGQRSYLLKVGTWARDSSLDWIGQNGSKAAASFGTLSSPVEDLAIAMDEVFLKRYVVSYCSPARSGKRTLEVVVKLESPDGKAREGVAESELNADGFNASCRVDATPAAERHADAPKAKLMPQAPERRAASSSPGRTSHASAPSEPVTIAEPPTGLGYE